MATITKEYRFMTPDEQVDLITRVAAYTNDVLPALTKLSAFSNEQKEQYREGVALLSHFDVGRRFAHDAATISTGFRQHTNRMSYLFSIVKRNLARELNVATSASEQVIVLTQSQSLRRGRPTAAESEQRERERNESARATAVAALIGARVATTEAAPVADRPSDTSRRKDDGPDLFSSAIQAEIDAATVLASSAAGSPTTVLAASPAGSLATVPAASPAGSLASVPAASPAGSPTITSPASISQGRVTPASSPNAGTTPDALKSLREWAWLLPDPLATRVKHLREIRNELAIESETAKRLFAQGAEQPVIAVHTQRAAELNRDLASIYSDVDNTLAYYFIMLNEVNAEFGGIAAKYEKQGGLTVLLNDLKPYFDKAAADESWYTNTLSRCQKDNDAAIAAAQRDPEKEKAIHKIKAYFSRKDVKISETRIQRMTQYYDEAQSLGCDSDTLAGLKAILDATITDFNS